MNRTTTLLAASALALLALAPGAQALDVGPVHVKVTGPGIPNDIPGVDENEVIDLILSQDPACGSLNDGITVIAQQCSDYLIGLVGPLTTWATVTMPAWALEYEGRLAATGQYFSYANNLSAYGSSQLGYGLGYANQHAVDPAVGFGTGTATDATGYASSETVALAEWEAMASARANDELGADRAWVFCRVSGTGCAATPPIPTLPTDVPTLPPPEPRPLPGIPPTPVVEDPPVFGPEMPDPIPQPPT